MIRGVSFCSFSLAKAYARVDDRGPRRRARHSCSTLGRAPTIASTPDSTVRSTVLEL